MIKLTNEEAQQVVNGLLACIPDNYKQAFNAINVLTKAPKEDKEKEKADK